MRAVALAAAFGLLLGAGARLAHERVHCRAELAQYGLEAQLTAGNPCWALGIQTKRFDFTRLHVCTYDHFIQTEDSPRCDVVLAPDLPRPLDRRLP